MAAMGGKSPNDRPYKQTWVARCGKIHDLRTDRRHFPFGATSLARVSDPSARNHPIFVHY